MPRISVVYDLLRWEEKAIYEAAKRKQVDLRLLDSKEFCFDLSQNAVDFGDVVLQRCVSYFRSLHLTALFEAKGVPVVNDLQSAITCGNKLLVSLALVNQHVPTPKTILTFTPPAAMKALEKLGYPAVLKPTMGSWGRLVALLTDRDAARAILEDREQMSPLYQVYYLQERVARPPRDIRTFVLGDRVIAAIYRLAGGDDWRTNTARGGKAEACPISQELEDLSLRAVRAVNGDGFYGVDLMESPNGLLVHEINNTTEFKNTVPATGVDIPGLLVDYLLERIA